MEAETDDVLAVLEKLRKERDELHDKLGKYRLAFDEVGSVAADGLLLAQAYRNHCVELGLLVDTPVWKELQSFLARGTLALHKHAYLKPPSAEPTKADVDG